MGEFNSDDHYIYYCVQEFLRRDGVALMLKRDYYLISFAQKRLMLKMHYLSEISKMTEWSLVYFQGKPFNITVIQVYATATNAEVDEAEWFHEDLQDLLELTPQKMSFSL